MDQQTLQMDIHMYLTLLHDCIYMSFLSIHYVCYRPYIMFVYSYVHFTGKLLVSIIYKSYIYHVVSCWYIYVYEIMTD